MVYLPELQAQSTPLQRQVINFEGYSVAPVIGDGQMRDMLNLSSDNYPNLSQRKPRGRFTVWDSMLSYPKAECMLVKEGKLAVICKEKSGTGDAQSAFFYGYNDAGVGNHLYTPRAIPAVQIDTTKSHKMVSIQDKIIIYPEKIWYDINRNEAGYMDAAFYYGSSTNTVVIHNDTTTVCTVTFTNYSGGDTGTDTGKTESTDLGSFTVNDVVNITLKEGNQEWTFSCTVKAVSGNVLTVPADTFLTIMEEEQTDRTFSGDGSFTMTRYAPDLDFVMESNNRLWGCAGQTIYASKLGDPTNWNYFQALSVDSYAVDVGTDGPFTGCCKYSNHLLFFKENCIHKVYGSKPSDYQILTAECYGLEAGSSDSICVVNETVFYKSKIGIMAYSGSLPEHISQNFGSKSYTHAIAGTDGAKYYVSMKTTDGHELLVFDLDKAMWHKEDDLEVLHFAYLTNDSIGHPLENGEVEYKNQLLYLKPGDDGYNEVWSVDPYIPTEDEVDIPWMAVLGDFPEYIKKQKLENKKIYSKVKMRMKMATGSQLTISVRFDGGDWQVVRHIYANDDRNIFFPIVPRRCDLFSIRIEGTGRCVIESVVREFRERSER